MPQKEKQKFSEKKVVERTLEYEEVDDSPDYLLPSNEHLKDKFPGLESMSAAAIAKLLRKNMN